MGYSDLLRSQPAFVRLWLGQIVSELGDWLQLVALIGLFPTHGRAAEALAGLFLVRMIPAVIWTPLAGVVADRYPRGKVMVACDVGRAIIALGYLSLRGPEDVALLYALVFAQESLTAFFEPARAAALPQIVPREALLSANALSGATWSAMLAIGAAVGGFITAAMGPRTAFLADAASFAASAILIAGVRIPRPAPQEREAPPDRFGLAALREGARYLGAHRPQALAAMVKGLWGAVGGAVFLYAIWAAEVFTAKGQDSARALGILYAGRGVGALLGPFVFRRIWGESVRALVRSIALGFVLAAAGLALLITARSALAGACFLICAHAGGSTVWVASTQLLQLTVPGGLQGRVFAVEQGAVTLSSAISSVVAGALIGRAFTSLAGATLVMAAGPALSFVIWSLTMARLAPRLEAAAAEHDALIPSRRRP